MNNKTLKVTCFFCRYEITKHNKSSKHVLYNKNLKPICRHCTKNKHKALDIKYKNTDTQCKLCNKPTLYKKMHQMLNMQPLLPWKVFRLK